MDSNSFLNMDSGLHVGKLVWAKLENFPWWPCRIVRESSSDCAGNNERYFLVELFSGPSDEKVWLAAEAVFSYNGIESFKAYAQSEVDKAPTKAAKEKLVDRYQLKVSMNRREQWETAVKLADAFVQKEAELKRKIAKSNSHQLNLKRKVRSIISKPLYFDLN